MEEIPLDEAMKCLVKIHMAQERARIHREVRQHKTSRSAEVWPIKERSRGESIPLEPSLWNDHTFNVEFSDHYFTFTKNFPSDN